MRWPATTRYGIGAAPGNLAFVQDFMNTLPAGSPRGADLLADAASAQQWLAAALEAWGRTRALPTDHVVLGDADLGKLRAFRAELVDLARAGTTNAARGNPQRLGKSFGAALRLDEAGRVQVLPGGTGWRYVASLLLIEVHDAQLGGTWRRLKTCANVRCSAAFFDRSRNNSRVWHDGAVCGNRANLQAHRARKRAAAEG